MNFEDLPGTDCLDDLRERQCLAWKRGDRLLVEVLIAELANPLTKAEMLELILAERILREECREIYSLDEYVLRFPLLTESLKQLFAIHEALADSNDLTGTPTDIDLKQVVRELAETDVPASSNADGRNPPVNGPRAWPTIGRYEIIEEIARGGMGVVYKAIDRQLDRVVALKLIKAGEQAGEEAIQRFHVEAQAAAHLEHAGIVPVYEFGQNDQQYFLAMAYVDGYSLWQQVKESPLKPQDAARLMHQVAEAIQYAHSKGVIHRDLKPQNILLTKDGHAKVTDFGLAKRHESDSSLTATGQVMGTASYMPPEQASGKTNEIGPLADIYSLGATLYCLLTGRPPFQAATQLETMRQVMEQEAMPPRQLNRAVPIDLDTIVMKCLEKHPSNRYGDAALLTADLGRFMRGEPILARPVSRAEHAVRWCRRNPVGTGLIGSLGAAVLISITSVWYRAQYVEAENRRLIANKIVDKQRQDAESQRRASEFDALVGRVKENAASPVLGWTWMAEEDLRKADRIDIGEKPIHEFRSLAADVKTRPDLRRVAELAGGIDAAALGFSSDGSLLAVGQLKSSGRCSVNIYSNPSRTLVHELTFSTVDSTFSQLLKGDTTTFQDGVRKLAWSPDNRWLVAGTRHGNLVRWDLQRVKPDGEKWNAHGSEILDVAFSADGQTLLSCGGSSLKRWSVAEGWKELSSPNNRIQSFAISNDSRFLIGVNPERKLELRDAATLQPIPGWLDVPDSVAIAISPDDRIVASVERQGGVQLVVIREIRSGAKIVEWDLKVEDGQKDEDGQFQAERIAFAVNGLIIVLQNGRRFHFVESMTGRRIIPLLTSSAEGHLPAFAISQKGGWLAVSSLHKTDLYEWRQPSGYFAIPQVGNIRGIDISPNGMTLATVTDTEFSNQRWRQLSEWEIDSGKLLSESRVTYYHTFWPYFTDGSVQWNPDGDCIAWCGETGGLMVSPATGRPGKTVFVNRSDLKSAVELDPGAFVESKQTQGAITVLDSQSPTGRVAVLEGSGSLRLTLPILDLPYAEFRYGSVVLASVTISSDSSKDAIIEVGMHTSDQHKVIKVPIVQVPHGGSHWCTFVNLNKKENDAAQNGLLLTFSSGENRQRKLTLDRAVELALRNDDEGKSQQPLDFSSLRWTSDGQKLLALFDGEKQLAMWDAVSFSASGNYTNLLKAVSGSANISSISVGARRVVFGERDGTIQSLLIESGEFKKERVFGGPGGRVEALAIGPGDAWFATGTLTGNVEIRELPSGSRTCVIPGHGGSVNSLCLARDGTLLATGCADGLIRIFEVLSMNDVVPRLTLRPRIGEINLLNVSRDGRWLVACTLNSHLIHVWDLDCHWAR